MQIKINNIEETKSLAKKIANLTKKGDIITLQGDLGAGKTAFARFFINILSEVEQDVLSPTFNLVHPYEGKDFNIWHFDLYRLEFPEEIEQIGLYDAFDGGVSLIEWPEIIDDILPVDRLLIKISFNNDERVAEVEGLGSWKDRISAMDTV
jgi:tRNA threonylcarbamoyl adenosine modification protein YjeE